MSRTPLIAANWKMNAAPDRWDASDSPYRPHKNVDVVVLSTFLDLRRCIDAGLQAGAQYGHPEAKGAHTGDVSMAMVAAIGCTYVICGHSERRRDHFEKNEDVAAQIKAALQEHLIPIVCVGETKDERAKGQEKEIVKTQLEALMLESAVIIAYEPVWAINTGKNASPAQAQEMHAFIRSLLPKNLQPTTRILYGGSMNGANAKELLSQPDIDGGLIGAASLKPDEFRKIVEAATEKNG